MTTPPVPPTRTEDHSELLDEDHAAPDCGCGKHKAEPPDYMAAFNAAHSLKDQFIAAYLDGLKQLVGRDFTDDETRGVDLLAEERWFQFGSGCFNRWVEGVSPVVVKHLPPVLLSLWREYWGRSKP